MKAVICLIVALCGSVLVAEPLPAFRFTAVNADGWAVEKRWETVSDGVDVLTVTGMSDSLRRTPSVELSLIEFRQ